MRFGITWIDEGLLDYPRLIRASKEAGFDLIGVPDATAATYRDGHVAMTLAVLNLLLRRWRDGVIPAFENLLKSK